MWLASLCTTKAHITSWQIYLYSVYRYMYSSTEFYIQEILLALLIFSLCVSFVCVWGGVRACVFFKSIINSSKMRNHICIYTQNIPLWYKKYSEHLSTWNFLLSRSRASQKNSQNSVVINPLPRSYQKRLTHHQRLGVSIPHQTVVATKLSYYPSVLLRAYLTSHKVFWFSVDACLCLLFPY